MSSFLVTPTTVSAASARLATIGPAISDAHGRLGMCAGAASQTPAHAAMEGLLAQWGTVLPHVAESGDRLAHAVGAAGAAYVRTDGAIASSAAPTP